MTWSHLRQASWYLVSSPFDRRFETWSFAIILSRWKRWELFFFGRRTKVERVCFVGEVQDAKLTGRFETLSEEMWKCNRKGYAQVNLDALGALYIYIYITDKILCIYTDLAQMICFSPVAAETLEFYVWSFFFYVAFLRDSTGWYNSWSILMSLQRQVPDKYIEHVITCLMILVWRCLTCPCFSYRWLPFFTTRLQSSQNGFCQRCRWW